MNYRTLNPATGELTRTLESHNEHDALTAISKSKTAFASWQSVSIDERASILSKAADELEKRVESLAKLMSIEMGKPIVQGRAEVNKCALVCRYYAKNAAEMLKPSPRQSDGSESYVSFEPLGPIFAIMPWNFPFWQLFRFAAPAFMAGNTAILKHAPCVPQCAEEMVDIFSSAGLPEGVFQNLRLSNEDAATVIAHPDIRGITFTGSSRAGAVIAANAGKNIKKTVLELGGSDPFVVFADADLEKAVKIGVAARCLNSGQTCIAAKRFIVHESILQEFTERLTEEMRAQVLGDPLDEATQIGPMAREDLRDELARQVAESAIAGAEILCGGTVPKTKGFWYEPTVLTAIPKDCPANKEELFGPVASIFSFGTEEEAISKANDTEHGLGASIWTKDIEKAKRVVRQIEAGAVFVNGLVKSDPNLPFGGVKRSGYGRELSREGLLEFTNQKTVWIS